LISEFFTIAACLVKIRSPLKRRVKKEISVQGRGCCNVHSIPSPSICQLVRPKPTPARLSLIGVD
jgi:hypothetical protein